MESFVALKTYAILWTVWLGLMYGAFFMVWLYRFGRDASMWEKSRCPKCGREIALIYELPVVSWIFLRGRCRACREKISVGYPLGEAACMALFAVPACVVVPRAQTPEALNQTLGYVYWFGFFGLVAWSSVLFRVRKIKTPNAFRAVVILCLATFFLPARFLYADLPILGKGGDYFVNFTILSTVYSIVAVVGFTAVRDAIMGTSRGKTRSDSSRKNGQRSADSRSVNAFALSRPLRDGVAWSRPKHPFKVDGVEKCCGFN